MALHIGDKIPEEPGTDQNGQVTASHHTPGAGSSGKNIAVKQKERNTTLWKKKKKRTRTVKN